MILKESHTKIHPKEVCEIEFDVPHNLHFDFLLKIFLTLKISIK